MNIQIKDWLNLSYYDKRALLEEASTRSLRVYVSFYEKGRMAL